MAFPSNALTDPIFGHAPIRTHFEDAALIEAMLAAEIGLARVQATLGLLPEVAAAEIATLSVPHDFADRIADGVTASGVPVPALLVLLRRQLSRDAADWLHFGATSQDIVDTAFCLCARSALDMLAGMLSDLVEALKRVSEAHSRTLMLARTRGQPATPITFGLRAAHWAQPLIGLEAELAALRSDVLRVQLGGASGSGSVFGESAQDIARLLAAELSLSDGPPWHTDRSGIRRLADWLGRLVAATGKIGRDVSLSTREEIAELRLTVSGGSSAMPHKSNPVLAEALQSLVPVAIGCETGLAAAAVHAEERDGAYWPVEWTLMPQLFEIAGAALHQSGKLLAALQVDAAAMRDRVKAAPSVRAEAAVFALAAKLGRVEALRIVSEALRSGLPLDRALADFTDIDLKEALTDKRFIEAAIQAAAQIFTQRNASHRGG